MEDVLDFASPSVPVSSVISALTLAHTSLTATAVCFDELRQLKASARKFADSRSVLRAILDRFAQPNSSGFTDRLDRGLHLLVTKDNRTKHLGFRQFKSASDLNHQHGLFGVRRDNQVELGGLALQRSDSTYWPST